ncbi:hypothetical protein LS71_001195 [Helicobacter jaachi]|uniref:Uncharacterized protein n=1 Tax=Helicobacter jaachi TaxID=1677920 RepID=A0A4U8TBT0_9HELI|nr:hypothetical protein [Helicobacter jaachi]TLD97396.1 hypothetical protein LS71_001195 [Helicobacter jaachi]
MPTSIALLLQKYILKITNGRLNTSKNSEVRVFERVMRLKISICKCTLSGCVAEILRLKRLRHMENTTS